MPRAPRSTATTTHARPDPGRALQAVAQQLAAGLAPRQHRGDRHEEQQGQPDRHGHAVEVGHADRDAVAVDRLDQQREHRAEQHDEGERGEQQVVGEERALPGERGVDAAGRPQAVAPPADEEHADADDQGEEAEEGGADAGLGEGVDRVEHARPGEERAEDREGERGAQQRQVPDPQHPPSLLDHHRVQVGGAGEPGQERGVLDRVPRPVAAPAQDLVGPPGAEHDADGEEAPGEQRPAPGLDQPALAHPAGGQRGDGEGERHGEPDVAEVEHRRVERHEDVVLQQRVRPGPVEAGRRVEAAGTGWRGRPSGRRRRRATTNMVTSAQPTSGSSRRSRNLRRTATR